MFKEILKASRNNQASIFAFTFKFKIIVGIKTREWPNNLRARLYSPNSIIRGFWGQDLVRPSTADNRGLTADRNI